MKRMKSHHGADVFHRGINAPDSRFYAKGKFGRLFPHLPHLQASRESLLALGQKGGVMDLGSNENEVNHDIPAGFVFFGQFIDHDITLDTTSSLEKQNDPEAIQNFRTPVLELDSVYGLGPDVTPFLYHETEDDLHEMLIDPGYPRDLPRNSKNMALIGDPRNDENIIISQLQLAFLKFHNAVLHHVKNFDEAQRLVRWHYQWLVLKEYLPLIVDEAILEDVYREGVSKTGREFFDWRHQPFIPVEFAVAAYRFGHAQVPGRLKINDDFRVNGDSHIPLFDFNETGDADPDDLRGMHRAPRRYVDWKYLFDTGEGLHQASKVITPQLSRPLFDLPFFDEEDDIRSLAQRNLLRGLNFNLPSGQAIARAMCVDQLLPGELQDLKNLPYTDPDDGEQKDVKTAFDVQTPLWYYILKEAQIVNEGKRLGPVGSRIVAEVLVGLLEGDRLSFARADPCWKPIFGRGDEFTMVDLFEFAGILLESREPAYA
jgi:hypothetical protein